MKLLMVFDFDQTLSIVHVFKSLAGWEAVETRDARKPQLRVPGPHATSELGQLRRMHELNKTEAFGPASFAELAFGGRERVVELRRFLQHLRDRGVQMIICTKGLVGVARACLSELGLLDFFTNVYGRIGDGYGETKYDQLIAKSRPTPKEAAFLGSPADEDWTSKDRLIARLKVAMDLDKRQVVLVDDDPEEIKKAGTVCRTLWVREAAGLTPEHFHILEELALEASTTSGGSTPAAAEFRPPAAPETRRRANSAVHKPPRAEMSPAPRTGRHDAGQPRLSSRPPRGTSVGVPPRLEAEGAIYPERQASRGSLRAPRGPLRAAG
eukprot:CAMPEP_0117549754 /NCGR_PEP_ID=MMETSP0784-20121206/48330_1 /TAXON_ID=39447 /ORGANISM="" /LENGTH=324 /DNA_ID=CAMNT_0005346755 /DNA_START=210 /DNA_END=1180 /DNA_ORIENTATION=+